MSPLYNLTTMTGTVKKIVQEKQFGFIKVEGSLDDFFFHRTSSPDWDELSEGVKVRFEEVQSPKGPRAENVVLA